MFELTVASGGEAGSTQGGSSKRRSRGAFRLATLHILEGDVHTNPPALISPHDPSASAASAKFDGVPIVDAENRAGNRSAPPELEELKRMFSERLILLMDQKGMGAAGLAARVRALVSRRTFSNSNIFHYRSGRCIPKPDILAALAACLEVTPEELMGTGPASLRPGSSGSRSLAESAASPTRGSTPLVINVEDYDGSAWLQISQIVPWPTALQVLQVLKGASGGMS